MGKDFFQRVKLAGISKWVLGGMDMDVVEGIILRVRKCRVVVGMAKVAARIPAGSRRFSAV